MACCRQFFEQFVSAPLLGQQLTQEWLGADHREGQDDPAHDQHEPKYHQRKIAAYKTGHDFSLCVSGHHARVSRMYAGGFFRLTTDRISGNLRHNNQGAQVKATAIVLIIAVFLSGCATAPPNTPGAGSGQTYTPIVDMQGVDPARYGRDLGECRTYAASVDNQAAAMQGAIGGAILFGVLSAALGGNGRMNTQSATAGGFAGLVGNENRAMGKQERIITNCMSGRGYRALDAAFVLPAVNLQPMNQPVQQVIVATPYAPATPSIVGRKTGEDTINAERVAKKQSCAATPAASLNAKGPGFETYRAVCTNGDTMIVRCEFGNCRVLR